MCRTDDREWMNWRAASALFIALVVSGCSLNPQPEDPGVNGNANFGHGGVPAGTGGSKNVGGSPVFTPPGAGGTAYGAGGTTSGPAVGADAGGIRIPDASGDAGPVGDGGDAGDAGGSDGDSGPTRD